LGFYEAEGYEREESDGENRLLEQVESFIFFFEHAADAPEEIGLAGAAELEQVGVLRSILIVDGKLGEGHEGFEIIVTIGRSAQDDIVAAGFAFATDKGGDPPDAGVEEEEGFGEVQYYIGEIVISTDMGEFVQEDGLDLVGGQLGEEAEGD
jgi:hypothetical protein